MVDVSGVIAAVRRHACLLDEVAVLHRCNIPEALGQMPERVPMADCRMIPWIRMRIRASEAGYASSRRRVEGLRKLDRGYGVLFEVRAPACSLLELEALS